MDNILIRRMESNDLAGAAEVHQRAFPRQTYSGDWLTCHFRAFPACQSFVAECGGTVVGLILWTEKSGFRKEAFVELEQIAVEPEAQGRGIGTELILKSLPVVAAKIAERGAILKTIIVNTRADNYAQELYRKTLGAEPVARIAGIFTADEVYLVARDVDQLLEKGRICEPINLDNRELSQPLSSERVG